MKLSLDRTLRVVWLVVGGLLLLFLVLGGVMILSQLIGNAGAGEDAVRVARENTPPRQEARAVRYGAPEPIRGTETRLVFIGHGDSYQRRGEGFSSSYGLRGGEGGGTQVNVVFLDANGARLLVDRPAFIHDVRYPSDERVRGDSVQTWITYVMAVDDSDGNGRLDERDPPALYVTDRDGRGLRAVLSSPLRYHAHETLDAGRMLVYALEPPAGDPVAAEKMRQRAFVYEVASGRLSPFAALDSATARAGQILAR